MTITMEHLAHLLDGREYGSEITPDEEAAAKEAGLVVIFGASDDLVELRGAIDDEVGAFGGTAFSIDQEGIIAPERDDDWGDEEMERWFQRKARGVQIEAHWCPDDFPGWSWDITTDSHQYRVFGIVEDGEMFCLGIVVELPRDAGP